jgi:hypothetical protein
MKQRDDPEFYAAQRADELLAAGDTDGCLQKRTSRQSPSKERPENQRRNHGKRQTYSKNVPHMAKLDALRGLNVR